MGELKRLPFGSEPSVGVLFTAIPTSDLERLRSIEKRARECLRYDFIVFPDREYRGDAIQGAARYILEEERGG